MATKVSKRLAINPGVRKALSWLEGHGSPRGRESIGRYGIVTSDTVLGVSMADIQRLAAQIGPSHELAAALWATGVYEARMLCAFVDEPERVTPAQMDRWCRDFDNWGYCDTLCFKLFDRTPHAWGRVEKWSGSSREFVKRTAFALLWSLALHDKGTDDEPFLQGLRLIERAATDERHYVKKAVNMALRAVGRRSPTLHAAATAAARRLAAAPEAAPRWIGRDALKTLTKLRR